VHDLGPSVPQLYSDDDSVSAKSLRKLNRSTAQAFIDLLGSLLERQSELPDRLQYLRSLFLNIAQILNKLRAHQVKTDSLSPFFGRLILSSVQANAYHIIEKTDSRAKETDG
jgi:hypothetical protein